MASDSIKAFETVMKYYTKIGDALARFQVLQNTFLEDHRIQELLAVFYSDILCFHKLAYTFCLRSSRSPTFHRVHLYSVLVVSYNKEHYPYIECTLS